MICREVWVDLSVCVILVAMIAVIGMCIMCFTHPDSWLLSF
nr:MAG TPA: hypothetical protein [Caudoviricetes sp.]